MSNSRIQYFCDILKTLDSLSGAIIVEEYTKPSMPRPVLNKMASVGVRSVNSVPCSRGSYRLTTELEIRLLFPCGMGDNAIAAATNEIVGYFTGRVIGDHYVKNISCGKTRFDPTAYAIRSNIVLLLDLFKELPNSSSDKIPTLSIGTVVFPALPESITLTRPEFKEAADDAGIITRTVSPREFTLKGSTLHSPSSDFFKELNSLTASTDVVTLVLPYTDSVNVRCKELKISFDSGGYGFDYSIVLIEKM